MLNAGAWQGEATLAVDRARRRRESLAVLLSDVDYFKRVNDTHGHLTGDAVLRTLAAEMRQQVRESDLVGRFGGEEFAIVLSGTTATEAFLVAERIRRGVGVVRVLTKDTIVGVTVSIGVAVLGSHGGDLGELLEVSRPGPVPGQARGPRPGMPRQPARRAPTRRVSRVSRNRFPMPLLNTR